MPAQMPAEPILFADDTCVIISNSNLTDFSTTANLVLAHKIEWFSGNRLVLNLEKTNILKFVTNIVCFLLGDSPASDIYMPTFRNTLSVPSSKAGMK